jgi:hypothetical protein
MSRSSRCERSAGASFRTSASKASRLVLTLLSRERRSIGHSLPQPAPGLQ